MLAQNLASGSKIQEVRLKMDQFSSELICYMRFVFRPAFENIDALTKVSDLEFEKFCVEQYMKMILVQIKVIEGKSSLEDDLNQLS